MSDEECKDAECVSEAGEGRVESSRVRRAANSGGPHLQLKGVSLARDTTVLLEEMKVADVDGVDDALILHSGAVCPTIHVNAG